MIKVDLMDICHHCVLFEPDSDADMVRNTVELLSNFNSEDEADMDTPDIVIQCAHRAGCKYIVSLIEKVGREEEEKTRQSEFLKMYPNASLYSDNILDLRPCFLDATLFHNDGKCEEHNGHCDECRRDYWMTPIKKEE